MSVKMEVDGLDNIINRLESMGKSGSRLEGESLKVAGEVIVEEARNNLESHGNVRTGKLKEGLKVGKVRKKGIRKYVEVGITKEDNSENFYGKFLEWGTSKMSAKPFLIPAYENKKNEAKKIIIDELKKGIGL